MSVPLDSLLPPQWVGRWHQDRYLLGQADRGRGALMGRGQGAEGWPRGFSGGRCGKSAHAHICAEALKTIGVTVYSLGEKCELHLSLQSTMRQ